MMSTGKQNPTPTELKLALQKTSIYLGSDTVDYTTAEKLRQIEVEGKYCAVIITDMERMNADLRQVVHAVHQDDPQGNRVSNIGGWQSAKTPGAEYASFVQEQSGKSGAVRALYAHILEQASSFLEQLQLPADPVRKSTPKEHGGGLDQCPATRWTTMGTCQLSSKACQPWVMREVMKTTCGEISKLGPRPLATTYLYLP